MANPELEEWVRASPASAADEIEQLRRDNRLLREQLAAAYEAVGHALTITRRSDG